MKPKETSTAKKEPWKQLHGKQKACYIWDYYKFPILVSLIFLYIILYTVYGRFSKKTAMLYTGLINVSAEEELTSRLSDGFLDFTDENPGKKEVQLYTGLYLASSQEDPHHEYTYASRMKILASIDGEQLDVVLMNKEAFDAFSQSGYLCSLEELLQESAPGLLPEIEPYLANNIVILEDNADDLALDSSLPYQAVTEEYPMGLNVSQKGIFMQAGFEEDVYLGVIKNSPRRDTAAAYIRYLYSE